MSPGSSAQISLLLADWGHGDQQARDALIPLIYKELRRIARRRLWRERPDHTLQSAALVNEAYLRLVRQEPQEWQNRAHFFGVAAQMMRHILVDHARNRLAAKRGAGAPRLSLDAEIGVPQKSEVDIVALDDALKRLTSLDPQQGRVIELRFFGGLSLYAIADAVKAYKRDYADLRVLSVGVGMYPEPKHWVTPKYMVSWLAKACLGFTEGNAHVERGF